jgi:hypothetical protein
MERFPLRLYNQACQAGLRILPDQLKILKNAPNERVPPARFDIQRNWPCGE